jgi:putative membrane protein
LSTLAKRAKGMAMSDTAQPMPAATTRIFAATNALLTLVVITFLTWLVYFNRGTPDSGAATSSVLPALNASLNALSALLIAAALIAVKKRRFRLHATLMLAALSASACFLVSYIYYHLHHGDTRFLGTGWVRPVYFSVLISHIVLSAVAFPMILTSMFLAVRRRFQTHRRVSRYTWAAWMYVSVTGVVVYLMLHT